MRDIDELREKLRSGDSAAPSGGGRFGWLVLVLVACGIAFGAVYFMPRILAFGSSSVVQTLPAVQASSAVPTFSEVQTSVKEFKATESTPSFLRFGEELPKPPVRGVVADDIAAAAPPAIRERLMRIEPPKSTCPEQPWWAIWRSA